MTQFLHMIAAVILTFGWGGEPRSVPEQPIHVDPPKTGSRYGSVEVHRLRLTAPIRVGAGLRELESSIGHESSTYWPGMGGTVALFGHRKTPWRDLPHGPFRHIERLRAGDKIVVTMPYGRYTYVVRDHRIIPPRTNLHATLKGPETLLLAACTDRHGGTSYWGLDRPHVVYRYVVRATLAP